MRVLKSLLFAGFAVLCAAAAQSPAPPAATAPPAAAEKLPTPEQLFSGYLKAKGGAELERKFSSRVMKGTFEVPAQAITGIAEMYMAAPDKFFSVVRVDQFGDFAQGFDGRVGWSSDPNVGLREFSGEELAQIRRHSQFYHDLRFSELYAGRRVTGKIKVGDKDAWVLEALPKDAPPEKFYFDVESGLLVRHDAVQITPEGRLDVEQYYSDYSPVDGLLIPLLLRHVDSQITWQVRLTVITHNVPVEAAKFAKPNAQ
jgi:hypothetical protein